MVKPAWLHSSTLIWPQDIPCIHTLMMTSSNGNIFRVTGPFWGNSPHKGQWISRTKSQWRGALMFSLICTWTNCWVSSRDASDLRCHRAHYDVTVMTGNWHEQQSAAWINFCRKSVVLPQKQWPNLQLCTQMARFMGPTWGPPGADRTQVGPMLAPCIFLSGYVCFQPSHLKLCHDD